MFHIALCSLHGSKNKIDDKITSILGGIAVEHSIVMFDDIDTLIASGKTFHLYFLNKCLRDSNEKKLLSYIEYNKKHSKRTTFNFLTYADDPITDKDCDMILESIRRYLDYDSMYLCMEFLTDQGFKSIAISKILFFEYCNRKICIKTQHAQYLCDDSLKNVLSLVSGYAFAVPHKSFIVNLRHIASIKEYIITMDDGSKIPLSQKKSHEFRIKYKKYISEHNKRMAKKSKKF